MILQIHNHNQFHLSLFQSNRQRITKFFFLNPHHFADEFALDFEFGISFFHLVNDKVADFIEKQIFEIRDARARDRWRGA